MAAWDRIGGKAAVLGHEGCEFVSRYFNDLKCPNVRVWKSSKVKQLGAGQVGQVVKLLTLVTKDTSLYPSPLMASKATFELVSLMNSLPILK